MKKFALLTFIILSFPFLALAQVPLPDSVTVTPSQNCCFNFTVKNRNSKQSPINDFHIVVMTSGVSIRLVPGPTAPTNWDVTTANADSVVFTGQPGTTNGLIRAGGQLGGFVVCFDNSVSNITVLWRTTFNGTTVSTGTLQLQCPVTCDQVTPTPTGNCCFNWNVLNANSPHTTINDFHVNVLTPGVTLGPSTPPAGWSITGSTNQTVTFAVGAAGGAITPGNSLSGFTTCFNMPSSGSNFFSVEWSTTYNGKLVCIDTVRLQCALSRCDSVGVQSTGDCCYLLTIKNRNTQQIPISDFHIQIITSGVTIRPTPFAPALWNITSSSSTQVDFITTGPPVMPGLNLGGFGICFDFAGGVAFPFQIIWTTTQPGAVICEDTLDLQCALAQRCDSVLVAPTAGAACCYDLTLMNRHTPPSPLNDLHLKIITPGATFRPNTLFGPWNISQSTSTEVTFATSSSALGSGQNLPGFAFCIDRQPNAPFQIKIYWESTLNNQVICHDTLVVVCDVSQSQCDSVRVRALDKCCFDFKVLNRHTPPGTINDFHVISTTPGVRIKLPPIAPAGWTAPTANSTFVSFETATNPIPINGAQAGFILCFDTIPASGVFVVKWRTTNDKKLICEDSLYLRCNEDPPACDTVETNKALDDCCYDIIIKNRHYPQTPINDAHFRIITPGVTFRPTPVAPTGWLLSGFGATTASFVTQTNPILPNGDQSGFILCFDRSPNVNTSFDVVWETTIDGKIICTDTLSFDCRPKPQQCDSVQINKNLDNCCYDFVVKNRHAGPIDDVHFKVITPGVTIVPTPGAPFGWGIGSLSSTDVYFKTNSAPIMANTDLAGYTICFNVPPTAPPTFQAVWQTTLQGKVICEDTMRFDCKPVDKRCDSLIFKRTNLDDCCFDFTILNRHLPAGPVNDWHLEVLTPGVTIRPTPTAPTNWAISNLTLTQVDFKDITGAGIPGGGNLGGFRICFDKVPSGQSVFLRWCSTLDGQVICCDTIRFICETQQSRCDSVIVKPQPNCCFDFTVLNRHLPAGPFNDWHLRVLTSGVTIRPTPTAPTNWTISNLTLTQVDFKEVTGTGVPSGGSASGFTICLDKVQPNTIVKLEWCTTRDGVIICCDTINVRCDPATGQCDRVTPTLVDTNRCCWNFTVSNLHQPGPSNINDFHIRVLTSGVAIVPAFVIAPAGWNATASSTVASFATTTSPLLPGNTLSGFIVCFNSAQIGNQPFKVIWETTLNDQVICRDTLNLMCPKATGVEQIPGPKPSSFMLYQNYPNPFNPTTTIEFELPTASDAELVVFDASGRTNVVLVKDYLKPGRYQVLFDATTMPSGTYFYRLHAQDYMQSRTMILVK